MNKAQVILSLLYALPIVLSFFYETGVGKLPLVNSLLAVTLFVFAFASLSARIRQKVLRLPVQLGVALLLAIYLYVQLLSYVLQGTFINQQFLFHFNLTTLVETYSAYWRLTLGFIAWVLIVFLTVLALRDSFRPGRMPATLLISGLLLALILEPGTRRIAGLAIESLVSSTPMTLAAIDWDELELDDQAIYQEPVAALPGKNLVLIYLEGLGQVYTEAEIFPGLTPTLAALGREGQRLFDLRQVSGSQWTMGGMVSSMCGTPLLYESSLNGNSILFTHFLDRATCLPDVLADAGYEQVFMGGASTRFAGKGTFLRLHGFNQVLGREELLPRLPDQSYVNDWGLFDDSLFSLAKREFSELAEGGEPFNLTLLTVDTHHPSGEPSRSCPAYTKEDNSILHAVHCTDFLVGDFIDHLKRHSAFANTVVVLVSDHLAMPNDAFSLYPEGYDRRLYFTVLNADSGIQLSDSAVPMDIAPTVLSLLGVEHNVGFLAGVDLTRKNYRGRSPSPDPDSNPLRKSIIAYLNSNVLSSNAEGVLLYSLDEGQTDRVVFSHHVTGVEASDSVLEFVATGADPYLILPRFDIPAEQTLQVRVEIESPAPGSVDLYYSGTAENNFSESRKLTRSVEAGEMSLAFVFDAEAKVGRIRIDPGQQPGRYVLRSVQVRAFQQPVSQ
ncbi:MAG: sulfatase-like hydrolase/transferase [Pseudohongiellaceae bacterium]